MGTPGKAKALRALASRKRSNRKRIVQGKAPVIGGKAVSAKTFAAKSSTSVAQVKSGGPPKKSQAMSRSQLVKKWGTAALPGKKRRKAGY